MIWVGGIATGLWLLNYAAVACFGYPVAYCWGRALLRPVLAPYASLLLLAASGYLFYALLRYGMGPRAIGAVAAMMLIAGAGDFARILLLATPTSCGNFS